MDLQSACLQQDVAHDRSFLRSGLMMSFSPSPKKLSPIVRKTIARPGKNEDHHMPLSIRSAPADRSRPQSGMSPSSPNPRKDNPAAVRIASAALSEKITGTAMIT